MKTIDLEAMSTDELVQRFAEIGVAQDHALLGGRLREFNRLFDKMAEVSQELKRREGDQRRALLALFSYPNMQVRLKAAIHALAVAPVEARRQIEEIAASQWYPQAGDAGMSLVNLDNGIFKPT
ncbi:MAG: DUF2019 domain-containing protein [Rhodopseudomonas palustris]|uniref:DUF2019 domain-containing protein n=1 Tax=Rhodopseudomonas palustris TaxID=1076 RepID=A0A933W1E0_RHOPL|nr:DUF2019 domain-containing protein [Rhodopseudomonas palustris]